MDSSYLEQNKREYELTKHGHRKLARLEQTIDAGVLVHLVHTVAVNYHWDTTPVVTGLRPIHPSL